MLRQILLAIIRHTPPPRMTLEEHVARLRADNDTAWEALRAPWTGE